MSHRKHANAHTKFQTDIPSGSEKNGKLPLLYIVSFTVLFNKINLKNDGKLFLRKTSVKSMFVSVSSSNS